MQLQLLPCLNLMTSLKIALTLLLIFLALFQSWSILDLSYREEPEEQERIVVYSVHSTSDFLSFTENTRDLEPKTTWLNIVLPDVPRAIYVRTPRKEKIDEARAFYLSQHESIYWLVNQGHEALAYLTFIVDHYDRLPHKVMFIHGHLNSWHSDSFAFILRNLNWQAKSFINLNWCQPSHASCLAYHHQSYDLDKGMNVSVAETILPQFWNATMLSGLGPLPTKISFYCCA